MNGSEKKNFRLYVENGKKNHQCKIIVASMTHSEIHQVWLSCLHTATNALYRFAPFKSINNSIINSSNTNTNRTTTAILWTLIGCIKYIRTWGTSTIAKPNTLLWCSVYDTLYNRNIHHLICTTSCQYFTTIYQREMILFSTSLYGTLNGVLLLFCFLVNRNIF